MNLVSSLGFYVTRLMFNSSKLLLFYFLTLRTSEIHLFYNLQLFYWHFLEILWLFIFQVFYNFCLENYSWFTLLSFVCWFSYSLSYKLMSSPNLYLLGFNLQDWKWYLMLSPGKTIPRRTRNQSLGYKLQFQVHLRTRRIGSSNSWFSSNNRVTPSNEIDAYIAIETDFTIATEVDKQL